MAEFSNLIDQPAEKSGFWNSVGRGAMYGVRGLANPHVMQGNKANIGQLIYGFTPEGNRQLKNESTASTLATTQEGQKAKTGIKTQLGEQGTQDYFDKNPMDLPLANHLSIRVTHPSMIDKAQALANYFHVKSGTGVNEATVPHIGAQTEGLNLGNENTRKENDYSASNLGAPTIGSARAMMDQEEGLAGLQSRAATTSATRGQESRAATEFGQEQNPRFGPRANQTFKEASMDQSLAGPGQHQDVERQKLAGEMLQHFMESPNTSRFVADERGNIRPEFLQSVNEFMKKQGGPQMGTGAKQSPGTELHKVLTQGGMGRKEAPAKAVAAPTRPAQQPPAQQDGKIGGFSDLKRLGSSIMSAGPPRFPDVPEFKALTPDMKRAAYKQFDSNPQMNVEQVRQMIKQLQSQQNTK